jgi:1-pyrroline-5-carboxylate dehydrogenase
MGPASDLQNYINAVIDEASFNRIEAQIANAKSSPEAKIVLGGKCDKSVGWFVEPTIIETVNPKFKSMVEEIFGPVLTVYPYEDVKWEEVVKLCDETSPYGLTGSVFGKDRIACEKISEMLRYAAGNFYINDRPTGAVVGCQPFGGARASGTDDKAGGPFNLFRWVCPRTIKETLVSPTDPFSAYPFIKR